MPRSPTPLVRAVAVAAALTVLGLSGCETSSEGPDPAAEPGGSAGATPTADAPEPGTDRVSSVTDGDTLRLATGEAVRLVGMDAPEPGLCGSERATRLLTELTLGKDVTLPAPVDDRDRYGRLLRYVDVNGVDAGLQLIRRGLAIARYDSRDGYDRHPRQARYVRADRGSQNVVCGP